MPAWGRSPRASGRRDARRLGRSVSPARWGCGTWQPAWCCRQGLGDLPAGGSCAETHQCWLLRGGSCSPRALAPLLRSHCFAPDQCPEPAPRERPYVLGQGHGPYSPWRERALSGSAMSPSQRTSTFYFFYDQLKISFASAKELLSQRSM